MARETAPTPLEQARALLAGPRPDLAWHHELGTLLRQLLEPAGGQGAVNGLAGQLGVSPARVYQHMWFVQLYSRRAAQELDQRNVPWSFVIALMGLEDEAERKQLLERAAGEKWTLARLRLEVRRHHPSRRPGAGRQRQPRRSHGPEVDLARLTLATREWLDLFEAAWADGDGAKALEGLRRVLRGRDGEGARGQLRELLRLLPDLRARAEQLASRLEGLAGPPGD